MLTLIKPWQVAHTLLRFYWSTSHSHEAMSEPKRFNIPRAQYVLLQWRRSHSLWTASSDHCQRTLVVYFLILAGVWRFNTTYVLQLNKEMSPHWINSYTIDFFFFFYGHTHMRSSSANWIWWKSSSFCFRYQNIIWQTT